MISRCLCHVSSSCSSQIIILTGATASGKSDVAMKFGTTRDVEIVVADSVQVMKHLNIGANKPTQEEMSLIPHHLVGIHEPHDFFSAADYLEAVSPVLEDILRRGKTPLVVGGSTMWVDWLLRGVPNNPGSTAVIKTEAAQWLGPYQQRDDWGGAVSAIQALDSQHSFLEPSSNDWYRLHRERKASVLKALPCDDVRCFFIGDERMRLYRDIDERCERMLVAGIIEETTTLLLQQVLNPLPNNTAGMTTTSPAASAAIGYRQTVDYLCRSNYSRNDRNAFMQYLRDFATATRNYAKRQLHWYRKDEAFLWLHGTLPPPPPPRGRKGNDSYGVLHKRKARVEELCEELLHWSNGPLHIYQDARDLQYSQAAEFSKYGNTLRRGMQVKSIDLAADRPAGASKWSGDGYLVRACEGVRDPMELRTYSPHFPLFAPRLAKEQPALSKWNSREGAAALENMLGARGRNGWDKGNSSTSVSVMDEMIIRADSCRDKLEQAGLLNN